MTIYYVDPEGGVDTNAGTSFATRKRTIANLAANVALTQGDEIRLMASRDPVSVGNAQWTDGNGLVVLDAPVTATIDDCEDGWLTPATGAAAGVTPATLATNRKSGSLNLRCAVANSAAAAGILAYKSLVEYALSGFHGEGRSANLTLSNSNKTATSTLASANAISGAYPLNKKMYFEVTVDALPATPSANSGIGLAPLAPPLGYTTAQVGYSISQSAGVRVGTSALIYANSVTTSVGTLKGTALAVGDNIGIAYDPATRNVWFRLNGGSWNGNASADPVAGTGGITIQGTSLLYPFITFYSQAGQTQTHSINYGETAFAYAAPTGYANTPTPIAATDFSAYQTMSLWLGCDTTSGFNSGADMYLDFCSDAFGQTPIVSVPFGIQQMGFTATVNMASVTVDSGAPFPNNVKSIALRTPTKIMSSTVAHNWYFDNIIACKAIGAAGHLSHSCLIGKNTSAEPEWHPIQYISGTNVMLGGRSDTSTSAPVRVYRGVTEKVNTYALFPTYLTAWGTNTSGSQITSRSGTTLNPIKVTGGWNRTDMSTQTGQTWLNARNMWQYVIHFLSGCNAWSFPDSTIGICGANTCGFYSAPAMTASKFTFAGFVNNMRHAQMGVPVAPARAYFDYANAGWSDSPVAFDMFAYSQAVGKCRRVYNTAGTGVSFFVYTRRAQARIYIGQVDGGTGVGLTSGASGDMQFDGIVFKNNAGGSVGFTGTGNLTLNNCYSSDATLLTQANINAQGEIRFTNFNGNRWDNRIYTTYYSMVGDQTVTHGTSAQSIKLAIAEVRYADIDSPYRVSLAKIACFAGKTVTYKAWVKKDVASNVAGGIGVFANGAIPSDAVAWSGASDSSWVQLSIVFTPTIDCVVEVFGLAYAVGLTAAPATPPTVWFGDPSVSST